MPSGRRPPPPPPPRDSDSAPPPPLPSRHPGNSQLVDDTYEQPACPPNSVNGMAAKLASLSPPVDNHDFDDCFDSDDSEWDPVEEPVTLPSDDYITPDGGIIPEDDYNVPNETQPKAQTAFKPLPAVPVLPVTEKASIPREDKNNNSGKKILPDTNRPKPPPNKPSTGGPDKPSVKPKPMNLSDPSLPKLPPRPGERSLKPQDSKSNLNDSKNLGSVSSESNTHLQDTKVHPDASGQHLNKKSRVLVFPVMHADIKKTAFQARAEKFEAVIGKKVADEQKAQDSAIYDDGASEMLSSFDWFHGELDREEGAQRVKKLYENGAFLIRASKSDGSNNSHPYTLVVTLDQKVYNLKIRLRHDSRFAIGTYKSDEVSFASVPELVEHHRENNIKLAEGGTVKLHRTPKK